MQNWSLTFQYLTQIHHKSLKYFEDVIHVHSGIKNRCLVGFSENSSTIVPNSTKLELHIAISTGRIRARARPDVTPLSSPEAVVGRCSDICMWDQLCEPN